MKNRTPDDRSKMTATDDTVRDQMSYPTASLSAAEIESLLKLARQNANQQAVRTQVEELGPGDVQYLQGTSIPSSFYIQDSQSSLPLVDVGSNPEAGLPQNEPQQTEVFARSDQAVFAEFDNAAVLPVSESPLAADRNGLTIEQLGDLNLDISIELGRTEILIDDVLKLREGSIVTLDKLAGDPVDIMANGRLVARGELLVMDGKFGVRLSEVL